MGQISSGIPASRSSSSGGGTNNLPPLLFHNVHGENIRISRDGTIARRVESFCKGIAFSSRPVKVNEKICVKFLEISNNWSGVIRFGFTYNNPSTLQYGLPKYACPDLTNKPGYWAKALPERFCNQNNILFYYVTPSGDVHFGVNGEEKGIFFSGVETRGPEPLWALIDVYGNSTAIEFVDIRHQLNNSRRNVAASNSCDGTTPDEIERIVYPMNAMSIHQRENEELSYPVLRYQPPHFNFQPMSLHHMKGRNVRFNSNRSVATRIDTEFCQGYVFTGRPLQIGERVVIQILATEPIFQGCLSLGLTSCDPSTLQASDLPDDSNFLLDRPEYWVISRHFARKLNVSDEISFCIAPNGEVQISRNGSAPSVVIHVDQTLKLWAFFDIYGSTRRIRILSYLGGASTTTPVRNPPERRIIAPPSNSESMNSINSQSEMRRNSAPTHQPPTHQPPNHQPLTHQPPIHQPPIHQTSRVCCVAPADIQVQQSANGGAVLSVILPPSHAGLINQQSVPIPVLQSSVVHSQNSHPSHYPSNHPHASQQQQQHIVAPAQIAAAMPTLPQGVATTSGISSPSQQPPPPPPSQLTTGTILSTCSNTYIEPISAASTPFTPTQTWPEGGTTGGGAFVAGTECTICYENAIDAVLYMCGHMCMCYECALQQWRGKGGGHCPLCRAVIRDVIRTYKS